MNLRLRRRLFISLLTLALLLPSSLPPRSAQSAASLPIWGRKPVLAYFLLTPSLAVPLQREVGLSAAQLEAAAAVARKEGERLEALELTSLAIVQAPSLSLAEKRQQLAAAGYNRQTAGVLAGSQAELLAALGEPAYTRLVGWIEARWAAERDLRRSESAAAAADGARSFKVFATRYDSGGVYTVALPDKCLKLANGGSVECSGYEFDQNYSVQIQYQSSVVVKVGESGPWNVDDNFWATVGDPQPRRLFTDLPLGMSEAQAAYFDDYNNGLDQFGRQVTSPVAIDLARQVSVDIGLEPGKNDWVTVTFPWTVGWGEGAVTEVTLKEPTSLKPAYSGDMCGSSWHKIAGFSGSSAYLTLNTATAGESTHSAEWVPDLPAAGEYRVEAFVPDHPPIGWECPNRDIPRDTSAARYTVRHAGGQDEVDGNQRPLANGWLDLGTYEFAAGGAGSVTLSDLTGEESYTRTVAFSAVRFIQVDPPGEPPPPPTPTPTPEPPPPPDPQVWVGSAGLASGGSALLPVAAQDIPAPGLTALSLEIRYDPAVIQPTGCTADPAGLFETKTCDLETGRDGAAPEVIHLELASTAGVSGDPPLAALTVTAAGEPGQVGDLEVVLVTVTGGGASLTLRPAAGRVCITPCSNILYFPLMDRLFEP